MIMKVKAMGMLVLAPWLVGAAGPADEATRQDIRCFIVVAQLSKSDDPAIRDAGRIGSQYFLGRIDGRAPTLDLESAVVAEAASAGTDQRALLASCGALMKKRGEEVEAIGARLTARGI
jgi:hypothetical protein